MEPDIVSKLTDHIKAGIKTESDALYVFAQVRKLLEKRSALNRPPSLWMYCNWALHVDLNYDNTTLSFLKKLDAYVQNNIAGHIVKDHFSFLNEHHLFSDLLHQETLRGELGEFFRQSKIKVSLCDDNNEWKSFLRTFSGVIEDGSLSARAQNLHAIEKVTFIKVRDEDRAKLSICWEIHLKDGRKVVTKLAAHEDFDHHSITIVAA